jgi:YD repeat-containing protein
MTQNYTYDLLNCLTQAQEGSAWTPSYLFDAFGNRALSLSSQYAGAANATPLAASSSSMPYDAYNHWTGAGVSTDNDGNLTAVNGQTMAYDAENRLTQVAGGTSGTISFTYDGTGRRVVR